MEREVNAVDSEFVQVRPSSVMLATRISHATLHAVCFLAGGVSQARTALAIWCRERAGAKALL